MGLDLKVNMDASWALLLGGGYWLPVLHFHSEVWAAEMEAEGGEGALGDAVLHSPLRIERLVDVIGPLVIEGGIDVTDVSVGRFCWKKGSLARAEIYNVHLLERQMKRQASGQQRCRRGRGRLASTCGRCGRTAFVADPSASGSSSSGDDAGGCSGARVAPGVRCARSVQRCRTGGRRGL